MLVLPVAALFVFASAIVLTSVPASVHRVVFSTVLVATTHDLHGIPAGKPVFAGLVPLPAEFGLRLVGVEFDIRDGKVQNQFVAAISIDVFDVPVVNQARSAAVGDGVRSAESIPNCLAGRVERIGLADGDGDDAAAVEVDFVRFAIRFHVDVEFLREVGDCGTAEGRNFDCGHGDSGTGREEAATTELS